MRKYKVTTKTQKEISSAFAAVFKDVKPALAPKPVSQEESLEPYRSAVEKQRERGMDWDQIAMGMADPRIGEKVSAKALKRMFGRPKKTPENVQPKRLVFDPATGQPVPPSTPLAAPVPVPPMTPKEHAAWDEMLKQLLPTIVNTAMHRNDAASYTDRVTERMKPADAARFHAVVESELEAMTETSCATYGITPEAYGKWHRRWVRS